jgi:thiamine-phosphate diphosphorylase
VHSLDEARAAAEEGASWLVAGHVFATATHPDEEGRGLPFVRAIAAVVDVPIIAIGGVRPEHCATLRQAGAYGLAVIRGIWDAANAERAASDYLSAYDDAAGA